MNSLRVACSCVLSITCVAMQHAWIARVLVEGEGTDVLVKTALRWIHLPIVQVL